MNGKLKDIRLSGLKEVFSRAKFARQADVSDKVIKQVEEKGYIPREDIQGRILKTVNSIRNREAAYTADEIFGK